MKNIKVLVLVCLFIFIVSSSYGYDVEEYHDEFEGYTRIYMIENWITAWNDPYSMQLKLNKYIGADKKVTYYFTIVYKAADWLFINDEGESLIFSVDGEIIKLNAFTGDTDVRDGFIYEYIYYIADKETIKKIIYAEEVKLKLKGSKGFRIQELDENDLKDLRRFYEEYIGEKPGLEEISKTLRIKIFEGTPDIEYTVIMPIEVEFSTTEKYIDIDERFINNNVIPLLEEEVLKAGGNAVIDVKFKKYEERLYGKLHKFVKATGTAVILQEE